MFHNREHAANLLARSLKHMALLSPVVVAIPRGGVVVGRHLADQLRAPLDVLFATRIPSPTDPHESIGGVAEGNHVHVDPDAELLLRSHPDHVEEASRQILQEMEVRSRGYREHCPSLPLTGRTVLLTDDGVATGGTMIAAAKAVLGQHPRELLVAVPVASPWGLEALEQEEIAVICLLAPVDFWAIREFFADFPAISDEAAIEMLRTAVRRPAHATV